MRNSKHERELCIVNDLSFKIGISDKISKPDSLENNDPPDVKFRFYSQLIGVECTTYTSLPSKPAINKRHRHRKTREEFFKYLESRDLFSNTGYFIRGIYFLRGKGKQVILPPLTIFKVIVDEIIALLKNRSPGSEIGKERMIMRSEIIRSGYPNIVKYIYNMELTKERPLFILHSEFISHIDFSDDNFIRIINEKSKAIVEKQQKSPNRIADYDEFWLLIHEGNFIQLMTSSILLRKYIPNKKACLSMETSLFNRFFVFCQGSVFEIQKYKVPIEY